MFLNELVYKVFHSAVERIGILCVIPLNIICKFIGNLLCFELRPCSPISGVVERGAIIIVELNAELRDQLNESVKRSASVLRNFLGELPLQACL